MCALFEIGWDTTGSKGDLEFVLVSVFCLVLHISAANTGSVMLAVFATNPLGGLPGGFAECSRGVPRRGTGWRSEERRGGQAGGLRSGCFRDRSPFSAPVRWQVEMAAVGGAEVRLSRQAVCFRGVIPHRSWWFGTPSTPSAPPAHHRSPWLRRAGSRAMQLLPFTALCSGAW